MFIERIMRPGITGRTTSRSAGQGARNRGGVLTGHGRMHLLRARPSPTPPNISTTTAGVISIGDFKNTRFRPQRRRGLVHHPRLRPLCHPRSR